LGDNIVLTDDNRNVLGRYEYEVSGTICNQTGTSDNTRKFTGKEFDADSNLYYYGARYYDPYIGRFTQRDPIGDGVNWYVYTRNNPLKFVDPTGLRAANNREAKALRFAFGEDVGNFLINTIDIRFDPSVRGGLVPAGTFSEIRLNPNYNSESLFWLGVFIHEAAHIWQKNTNRHWDGTGGVDYDYNASQLASLDLEREEHAKQYKIGSMRVMDVNMV